MRIVTMIVAILSLGSCAYYSSQDTVTVTTTTYTNVSSEVENPPSAPVEIKTVREVVRTSPSSCGVYIAPKLPKQPEPPLATLKALNQSDWARVDDINIEYNKALVAHIREIKQLIDKANADYARVCPGFRK